MPKKALETNSNDHQLVGYARVSTAEQNLSLQIEALIEFGVPESNIWSEKKSALAQRRPKLAQCLKYLEEGDTLVVWKLDRFARSLIDLLNHLKDLEARGIKFVSLTDEINTSTPGGRLLFHMLASLAQFERDLIQQRTTAGVHAKMAKGWKPGPKRILTEAEENQVVRWRDKGLTAPEIVANVKEKYGKKVSPRTVKLTYERVAKREEK